MTGRAFLIICAGVGATGVAVGALTIWHILQTIGLP